MWWVFDIMQPAAQLQETPPAPGPIFRGIRYRAAHRFLTIR